MSSVLNWFLTYRLWIPKGPWPTLHLPEDINIFVVGLSHPIVRRGDEPWSLPPMTSMRGCLGASNSKYTFCFLAVMLKGFSQVLAVNLSSSSDEHTGRSSWCPLPWYCPSLRQPAAVPSPDSSRTSGLSPMCCLGQLQSLLFAVCLECSSGLPRECSKCVGERRERESGR